MRLDIDILSLRSLIAVVDAGSFSAAAQRVNRTQSAVSLQISKLEEKLNVKILERTSRKLSVTEKGEIFVNYARRIVELADDAIFAVSAPSEKMHLRVGFAEYLAPHHLHGLLAKFRRAYPNCDLSLSLGLGSVLLKNLEAGQLDLVFAGPEAGNGQILWKEPLVWVGATQEIPPSFSIEVDEVELVLMHPPCSYRQIAFSALTQKQRSWRLSIDANSVQAVQSAVRAGLGISVLPLSAVSEGMEVLNTASLPPLPETSVSSYFRQDQDHLYAQKFVDFLMEGIDL